jgi:hypothetical protein
MCCMIVQSEDGKTRTNVFVMVVTEMLDDWEDATAIGNYCSLECMYCWISIKRIAISTLIGLMLNCCCYCCGDE